MSSFITQCPHCETSFNITQEQLQLAKGKVRCGFCLQVFSALEQQLFFEEEDIAHPDAEKLLSPEPKSELDDYYAYLEQTNEQAKQRYTGKLDETNDSLNSDEDIDPVHEEGLDSETYTDLEEDAEEYLTTTDDDEKDDEELESIDSDFLDPDTEISEEEDAEDKIEQEAAETTTETSAETTNIDENELPPKETLLTADNGINLYEEEIEEEISADSVQPFKSESESEIDDPQGALESESKLEHSAKAVSVTKTSDRKAELQSLESLYDEDSLNNDGDNAIPTLIEEPIPIYRQYERTALFTFLLFSANFLLLLMLAGQYAWKNIDDYLRDDRFAALTGFVCKYADCPTVERFDLSLFSTDELLVNSHPSIADALQIDFIFRNTAEFEQIFPLVELNFSDLNRRLVANRLFRPEEYLDPELQQFTRLPANSSIQVRLEISDPGPEAINYSLTLRTP